MSSRRKSSTPCMVRNPKPLPQEEQPGSENQPPKKQPRGYECKYCPFSTQNLNDFKEHVDSNHPNVILNPLYLCAICNFNSKKFDSLTEHNDSQHPGETNFKFKRIKMNNQTILEQTIESKDNSAESEETNEQGETSSTCVFPPCISTTVKTPDSIQSLSQGSKLKSQLDGLIQKNQITAVNINGTVIIPEPSILQGLSHVTPMLQRPPNLNSVPKIAVPLNTTNYNPSLDDNLTLITSFNKFPYPTHAELSWLTAASKHPEEQIKVWFTTQRLKQGITWSPEEVEEARKKMFNGSIPPTHHTFSVLPTSPVSQPSAKSSQQPIVHTTVEHPGHLRTTASIGLSAHTITNSPAGVAVGSGHTLKRSLPTHPTTVFGPESKRPIMAVAPHSGDPKDKGLMAPPPPPPLQKEQQGVELKASYPRGDKVLTPLAEANGTSRKDGKWPHNQTSTALNNGVIHLDGGETAAALKPDFQQKSSVLTQFPLLERMKGKTAEQLKVLEENFLRNSFPTHSDVESLSASTRLSHQEIDSWFVERRALRDNLEQALLNSMGTKRTGMGGITDKRLHQEQQQNQTLTISPSVPSLNSCSVPPDSRSLALLKDDFAQTRWPSPEELSQPEARPPAGGSDRTGSCRPHPLVQQQPTAERCVLEMWQRCCSTFRTTRTTLLQSESQDTFKTEAAERGRVKERGTEWGSRGRSTRGVRELAGRRTLSERTGAASGQREEDGGGRVWEADRLNGERSVRVVPCFLSLVCDPLTCVFSPDVRWRP
uniref:Homeobox domain-containing protein n=1 Tax=Monopterus albus TaxID=43700 RepID=A0A3Q3JS19_MONAL